MTRPPFIVLEGIEGSGKSTQTRRLERWLDEIGVAHVLTREPGGTSVGERIRETVLHGVDLSISPETELLLMLAARAAFVQEVVRPALKSGMVVVSDRFSWSTLAYQGYGRELPLDQVTRMDAFATGGLVPDLYVLLDVSARDGLARQGCAGIVADRFEGEGETFLERVRAGYVALVEREENAVRIDGMDDADTVHARIRAALAERFPETFSRGKV